MNQAKPDKTLYKNKKPTLCIPLIESHVKAGFPSPGENEFDTKLDLNTHLIDHPAATFFIRVSGSSMEGAQIFDGDLLIVDRSIEAREGHIVIARIESEFTVKRLKREKKRLWLFAENPHFPPIEITNDIDFEVWGVVTYVIHKAK